MFLLFELDDGRKPGEDGHYRYELDRWMDKFEVNSIDRLILTRMLELQLITIQELVDACRPHNRYKNVRLERLPDESDREDGSDATSP